MCPNCEHTMQCITSNLFWCPRCGTVKQGQAVHTPIAENRIMLSEDDFRMLIAGDTVQRPKYAIALSDIGFQRMISIIRLQVEASEL